MKSCKLDALCYNKKQLIENVGENYDGCKDIFWFQRGKSKT